MIYDNNQFLTTEGPEGGWGGGEKKIKKILGDPDRLHKSALFKWANIIWSAALWSIIPDSYPSRERGINHRAKLFSSAPPPTHTHTPPFSLHHSPHPSRAVPCQVCFVVFFACPVKRRTMLFAVMILNGSTPQSV